MKTDSKLMEMLVTYAAAHQHPLNVFVHLIGIPLILLGILIPLSWVTIEIESFRFTLAHVLIAGLFLFYLTLDLIFALAFLLAGLLLALPAAWIAELSFAVAAGTAAVCFFGGYAAQFVGHAIEKSLPVLVLYPLQANLAAPFFSIVELFKLAGLRDTLFDQMQREVERRQGPE